MEPISNTLFDHERARQWQGSSARPRWAAPVCSPVASGARMNPVFMDRGSKKIVGKRLLVAASFVVLAAVVLVVIGLRSWLDRGDAASADASTPLEPNMPGVEVVDGARQVGEESERRQDPSQETPLSDQLTTPEGWVVILDYATRQPAQCPSWRLLPWDAGLASGAQTEMKSIAGIDGRLSLRAGEWIMSDPAGVFELLDLPLRIRSGETVVAFAQQRGALEFLVVDVDGTPIPDALCTWIPRGAVASSGASTASAAGGAVEAQFDFAARTGIDGRVRFEDCPRQAGVAVVVASGRQRVVLHLAGGLSSPVRVVLRDCVEPGSVVRVVSAADGEALREARVRDRYGVECGATRSDAPGVFLLECASFTEQLEVTAPGHCTSLFRLQQLPNATVELHPSCEVVVHVRSAPEGEVGELHTETTKPRSPGSAWPLMPDVSEFTVGTPCVLSLPRGMEFEFTARTRGGASGSTRLVCDAPEMTVELFLGTSAPEVVLEVVDEHGAPLDDAWVSCAAAGGRTREFLASPEGVITVTGIAAPTLLEVGADGFAAVGLRRTGEAEAGLARPARVRVLLTRGHDVPIRVVTATGQPVPGARVSVWRAHGDDVSRNAAELVAASGAGWKLQNPRARTLLTDAEGRMLARNIGAGMLDVRVRQPLEYATSNSGQMMYDENVTVEVHDASPVEIVCSHPRVVALEVREEVTRLGVPRFELLLPHTGRRESVEGSFWQGWLPSNDLQLEVTAPSFGATTISVATLSSDAINEIYVRSRTRTRVEVTGLSTADATMEVRIDVLRDRGQGSHIVCSIPLVLVGGAGELSLPADLDLRLGISDLQWKGRLLCFEPRVQPYTAGETVRFVVR